jgi:hypothetical protein
LRNFIHLFCFSGCASNAHNFLTLAGRRDNLVCRLAKADALGDGSSADQVRTWRGYKLRAAAGLVKAPAKVQFAPAKVQFAPAQDRRLTELISCTCPPVM